jgi:hypothetical protein
VMVIQNFKIAVIALILALSTAPALACDVTREMIGQELHLEFIEGIDVKIGKDSGKPALKLRMVSSFGTHEYAGLWLESGKLAELNGYRSYPGPNPGAMIEKKLISVYAFLNQHNQINWMVIYQGRHLSGADATILSQTDGELHCEEVSASAIDQIRIPKEEYEVIGAEVHSISDEVIIGRLGEF